MQELCGATRESLKKKENSQAGEQAPMWKKPDHGVNKINTNAAFKNKKEIVGIVARNEESMAAWWWKSSIKAQLAIEAEMLGVFLAVQLSKYRNILLAIL